MKKLVNTNLIKFYDYFDKHFSEIVLKTPLQTPITMNKRKNILLKRDKISNCKQSQSEWNVVMEFMTSGSKFQQLNYY